MIHEDEDVYITRRGEVLLKQQCTFEFNGMRCGLKEGHEGAHVSEEVPQLSKQDSQELVTTSHSKSTPGPWFAGTGWIGAGEVKDGHVIARVPDFPYRDSEANAKLIAAAPEMLEALEQVYVHAYDPEYSIERERAWTKVKTAIRKAKGQP